MNKQELTTMENFQSNFIGSLTFTPPVMVQLASTLIRLNTLGEPLSAAPIPVYDHFARSYSFWSKFYKYCTVMAAKVRLDVDFEAVDSDHWGDYLNRMGVYIGWYYNPGTAATLPALIPTQPSANRLTDWLDIRKGRWTKGMFANQVSLHMRLEEYFNFPEWEQCSKEQFNVINDGGALGLYTGVMNPNGQWGSYNIPGRTPSLQVWVGCEFSADNSNSFVVNFPDATMRTTIKYYCKMEGPYYSNMNQYFNTGNGPNVPFKVNEDGSIEVEIDKDYVEPPKFEPKERPGPIDLHHHDSDVEIEESK